MLVGNDTPKRVHWGEPNFLSRTWLAWLTLKYATGAWTLCLRPHFSAHSVFHQHSFVSSRPRQWIAIVRLLEYIWGLIFLHSSSNGSSGHVVQCCWKPFISCIFRCCFRESRCHSNITTSFKYESRKPGVSYQDTRIAWNSFSTDSKFYSDALDSCFWRSSSSTEFVYWSPSRKVAYVVI